MLYTGPSKNSALILPLLKFKKNHKLFLEFDRFENSYKRKLAQKKVRLFDPHLQISTKNAAPARVLAI